MYTSSINNADFFPVKLKQKVETSNTPFKTSCQLTAACKLPVKFSNDVEAEIELLSFNYKNKIDEVIALVHKGDAYNKKLIPVVRVHSACLTSEVFGSQKCDCNYQFLNAMKEICTSHYGIMLYMASHEGRGIGLGNKILAYKLQEEGANTLEANKILGFEYDQRDFQPAVEVLKYFNIKQIKLLTNNPDKINALEADGIKVVEQLSSIAPINEFNEQYLLVKRNTLKHNFKNL